MGSSSGNCSASGAVLMARLVLVVLVAVFAGTSSCGAQLDTPALPSGTVTITFKNLETQLATVFVGSPQRQAAAFSVDIPPGDKLAIPIDLRQEYDWLKDDLFVQVGTGVYSSPETLQSMFLDRPGTVMLTIDGPCKSKKPGLQLMGTSRYENDAVTFWVCAALMARA